MFTTLALTQLLGYIGDLAFVIGGVLTAKQLKLHWFVQWLSGMSTAFFGGILLRDTLLLQTSPAIFCEPIEIAATAAIGIFAVISVRKRTPGKAFDWLLCIIDSIGITGFAAVGYGRGIEAGVMIALACGFVTACGGGIIAAAIRAAAKKSIMTFFETLAGNRWYYVFGASMSIAYGILDSFGKSNDTTLIVLTALAIILGLLVERDKSARDRRRP
jgi:uncharacterized membrane protein YeiH